MTNYGKLMGYEIETISGSAWQKLYHMMQNKGYTTAGKISLNQFLNGKGNDAVIKIIDQYCPTKYHIKPVLSSARNIVFFAREHIGGFADRNKKHLEFAERIIKGMRFGGYKVHARYISDMVAKPFPVPVGSEVQTLKITDDYDVHVVFEPLSMEHIKFEPIGLTSDVHGPSGVGLPIKSCNGDLQHFASEEPIGMEVDTEYKRRINGLYDKQYHKGKGKYGVVLEENKAIGYNGRLDHLAEELMDGLQYIEHNRDILKSHEDDVIDVISTLMLMRHSVMPSHAGLFLQSIKKLQGSLQRLVGDDNEDEQGR